jgi:hypothetical protein
MSQPTGAITLDITRGFLSRFVAFPSDAALDVVTLWIAHTHVTDRDDRLAFDTTPRLAFLSKGPKSGKTEALNRVTDLAHNGSTMVDPTHAGFAQSIGEGCATVTIDELDVLFGAGSAKATLRSLLNAGYKRGAEWKRAGKAPVSVFGAVAMAGMDQKFRNSEPLSALRSRTLMVPMSPGRAPEIYRGRMHDPTANAIRASVAAWCRAHRSAILANYPDEFDGISGRDLEISEPLLMIADAAGGRWPDAARAALRELLLGEDDGHRDDSPSLSSSLLADLATVFGSASKLPTSDIVAGLRALPGAPWAGLWPSVDNAPRELAALLAPVGVAPVRVRLGKLTVRGYQRADLAQHWA